MLLSGPLQSVSKQIREDTEALIHASDTSNAEKDKRDGETFCENYLAKRQEEREGDLT